MAVTDKLQVYLRLERLMLDLDERGDVLADRIRDLMDPIWYSLSEADRQYLDSRGIVELSALYPVTLVVPDLFRSPSEPVVYRETEPDDGVGKRFPLGDDVLCPV